MKILDIDHLVDKTLCGNDEDNIPKPAPDNIQLICQELGVDPRDTVMVGEYSSNRTYPYAKYFPQELTNGFPYDLSNSNR